MRTWVTNAAGQQWQLPDGLEWEMEYGVGTPCDSFRLICPLDVGQGLPTGGWYRFFAEHDGRRVFTGVVDECEVSLTGRGCRLELSGRGLAALLLDNEALGQDYMLVTLEDILRDHVAPYGIQTLPGAKLPHLQKFRVETGSSEWTVLETFLRAHGCGMPRFDHQGRLVLTGWEDREVLILDDTVPVTSLTHRDKRYGVLSQVLVRDRYSGNIEQADNRAFLASGGQCRRVLTMPGHSSRGAMALAGQEQLERSVRELEELVLEVSLPFYAMPGALIRLQRTNCPWNGSYRVAKTAAGRDEKGDWTRLTLRQPDRV